MSETNQTPESQNLHASFSGNLKGRNFKYLVLEEHMAGAVQDNKGFGGMGQHFKDSEKMKNLEKKIKQGRLKNEQAIRER